MKLVEMVRNPADHPAPYSASVHPDEVSNYRVGGYVLLDEANFEVPQPGLPFEAPAPAPTPAAAPAPAFQKSGEGYGFVASQVAPQAGQEGAPAPFAPPAPAPAPAAPGPFAPPPQQ